MYCYIQIGKTCPLCGSHKLISQMIKDGKQDQSSLTNKNAVIYSLDETLVETFSTVS